MSTTTRPSATTVSSNDRLWAAIAEPSRRKLLDLLLNQRDATASTLAGSVPFSRQAVSKHMAVLQQAGLIRTHKIGKERRFSIDPTGISEAAQELSRAAASWNGRLQKIKQLAEEVQRLHSA